MRLGLRRLGLRRLGLKRLVEPRLLPTRVEWGLVEKEGRGRPLVVGLVRLWFKFVPVGDGSSRLLWIGKRLTLRRRDIRPLGGVCILPLEDHAVGLWHVGTWLTTEPRSWARI